MLGQLDPDGRIASPGTAPVREEADYPLNFAIFAA